MNCMQEYINSIEMDANSLFDYLNNNPIYRENEQITKDTIYFATIENIIDEIHSMYGLVQFERDIHHMQIPINNRQELLNLYIFCKERIMEAFSMSSEKHVNLKKHYDEIKEQYQQKYNHNSITEILQQIEVTKNQWHQILHNMNANDALDFKRNVFNMYKAEKDFYTKFETTFHKQLLNICKEKVSLLMEYVNALFSIQLETTSKMMNSIDDKSISENSNRALGILLTSKTQQYHFLITQMLNLTEKIYREQFQELGDFMRDTFDPFKQKMRASQLHFKKYEEKMQNINPQYPSYIHISSLNTENNKKF